MKIEYRARGDPPLLSNARGDPGLFFHSGRDGPSKVFLAVRDQTGQYHRYGENTPESMVSDQWSMCNETNSYMYNRTAQAGEVEQ